MVAAVVAIGLTSCKDKASDKMEDKDNSEMASSDAKDMAADNKQEGHAAMKFDDEMFDFGTINEGDVVTHNFTFTNTGDEPLVITKAKGSCGCTIPNPPKEAIAPGEKGEMMVKFNSNGKKNNQMKTVRITANTKTGTEMIKIKAFVTPKDKAAGNPVK